MRYCDYKISRVRSDSNGTEVIYRFYSGDYVQDSAASIYVRGGIQTIKTEMLPSGATPEEIRVHGDSLLADFATENGYEPIPQQA